MKKEQVRKGELWMSMHRRHAGMVVGDVTFYRKFKLDCHTECVKDEMYAQTLLYVKDPQVRAIVISVFREDQSTHYGQVVSTP